MLAKLADVPQLAILLSAKNLLVNEGENTRMNNNDEERNLPIVSEATVPQKNRVDFTMQRVLPDRRRLVLMPHEQGVVLAVTLLPPFEEFAVYDDRYWVYDSPTKGMIAFQTWNPREEEEPYGWVLHPATHRYRPGGQRSMEYVVCDLNLSLLTRVEQAIYATQGTHRIIKGIEEADTSRYLPIGIRHFIVHSESTTCPHDPTCRIFESVFTTGTRCVVYTIMEFFSFSYDILFKRLLEDANLRGFE
jgi:hypothetical protein